LRFRSGTRWNERIGVVQREWSRLTYLRHACKFCIDCARSLDATIIILRKQAQLSKSLYSCGYAGAEIPCLVRSRQPVRGPDLQPDLALKPGRLRPGSRQVAAGGRPGVKPAPAAGRGLLPALWSTAVLPGCPGPDLGADPEPRWSNKPDAVKKWGSLAGRFR
jgi:hypothetical protein